MADNITLDAGAGGATLATDDVGGTHYQINKLAHGALDSVTLVSTASGLPVQMQGTWNVTNAGTFVVQVDGDALTALQLIDDLVLAEDAVHGDGDPGVQMLAVRKATPADLSGADGDYEPLQLDNGRLWISGILTSLVPGTGATSLGKAIDSAVGATDTGVAMLAKHDSDVAHLTTAEGDYEILRVSDLGALQTAPEQHHTLDNMNATAGWAALGNDTLNLATTKKHVLGTDALTFDKVNGAANTVFAAIVKTISAVDLGEISMHDLIQTACYIPDLTDVDYVFVRVGTDASNYNEWRVPDVALTAATFETLIFNVGDVNHAGVTGNGWNPLALTYIVVGVAFDAETNALAGIIFDELSFHTNQHTSAELNAEVSSSVSSANVNLQKVGGSATDKGAGNASNGSQRVVVATDDVNLAAIKLAIEILDDWDESDRAKVNPIVGQAGIAAGAGAVGVTVPRMTLASDDPAVAALQIIDDWDESDRAKVNPIVGQAGVAAGAGAVGVTVPRVTLASDDPAVAKLGTIDADTGAIKTAVELLDNAVAVLGTATYTETTTSGLVVGAVRNDALAALAGTDNEIAPLQVDEDGALWTHPSAAPKGGCKMFTSVDLDESEEDPSAGPTTIYGIYVWNATAAPLWLQMFNTNTVTVGTTAPTNNFLIPANADSDGAGVVIPIPVCGLAYDTALTVAITTGSGTDNGAPAAGAAGIAILYQD